MAFMTEFAKLFKQLTKLIDQMFTIKIDCSPGRYLPFIIGSPCPGARLSAWSGRCQSMNLGHFYGKVIEASNNKPMEAVSVQLIQSKFDTVTKKRKDVIISGMLNY